MSQRRANPARDRIDLDAFDRELAEALDPAQEREPENPVTRGGSFASAEPEPTPPPALGHLTQASVSFPYIASTETPDQVKDRLPEIQAEWDAAVGQGTPWPEPGKLQAAAERAIAALDLRSVGIMVGSVQFVRAEDGAGWQMARIWAFNGKPESVSYSSIRFTVEDIVTLAWCLAAGARLAFNHQFSGERVPSAVVVDSTGGKVEPERFELKGLVRELATLPGWESTSDGKNTAAGPEGGTYRVQARMRVAKQQVQDWKTGEWKDDADVKLPAYPPLYELIGQGYPRWHAPTLQDDQRLRLCQRVFRSGHSCGSYENLIVSTGYTAGRTGQEELLRPKSFLLERYRHARIGSDLDMAACWEKCVQEGREARESEQAERAAVQGLGGEGERLEKPSDAPSGTIVIWHSAEAGTVIVGTERSDAPAIKTLRSFQWSKHIGPTGAWYIPSTRGLAKPNKDLQALRRQLLTAGVTKPILVHEERVSQAEAHAVKAELRAESEANAPETLDRNAERLERKGLPLVDSAIGRQRPTARRQRIAESMRERGEPMLAMAAVLRKLAEIWRAGGPFPRGYGWRDVRTPGHVRTRGGPAQFWRDLGEKAPSESPEAIKARAARARENLLVGTTIAGYFPTPEGIASELVERTLALVDLQPGDVILEPSAGDGALAREAEAQAPDGVRIVCIEQNSTLCGVLREQDFEVLCGSFAEDARPLPGGGFDWLPTSMRYGSHGKEDSPAVTGIVEGGPIRAVVMNPPFENGQDAAHVLYAWSILAAGGALGAIVSEGLFFRQDKKATAFREWLESIGADVEQLPENAFMDSRIRTTGVRARMVFAAKVGGGVRPAVERPVAEPEPAYSRADYLRERAVVASSRAAGLAHRAEAAFDRAHKALEGHTGEPIKVGHHSEGRHRRDIARADAAMRQSIEAAEAAKRQEYRVRELERRAEAAERVQSGDRASDAEWRTELGKRLQRLKKDAGAAVVRQGYKVVETLSIDVFWPEQKGNFDRGRTLSLTAGPSVGGARFALMTFGSQTLDAALLPTDLDAAYQVVLEKVRKHKPGGAVPESQKEPAPTPEAKREWVYGAINRPPGYATAPSGIVRVDPAIKPRDYDMGQFIHGFAVYDRPLTPQECYSYELTLIGNDADAAQLVARIAFQFKENGEDGYFLEMWDDPDLRASAIENVGRQWEDFNRDHNGVPVWVQGGPKKVAGLVHDLLRGKRQGNPKSPEELRAIGARIRERHEREVALMREAGWSAELEELGGVSNMVSLRIEAIPETTQMVVAESRGGAGGVTVVHRSTKQPGRWQISLMGQDGTPWGDTQRDTLLEAVKEARFMVGGYVTQITDLAGTFGASRSVNPG